jgi:quercetin dioxygenase-like cupin family protein
LEFIEVKLQKGQKMGNPETQLPDEPRVEVLSDLIAYQRGGVVSRTLIKENTGTVTIFAFDANEELSEHTAPFHALLIALDGAADVVISGKLFAVRQGQTILLPAHQPHGLKAISAFKMLLIMIRSGKEEGKTT